MNSFILSIKQILEQLAQLRAKMLETEDARIIDNLSNQYAKLWKEKLRFKKKLLQVLYDNNMSGVYKKSSSCP